MSDFFVVEPQSPEAILEMFNLLEPYQVQHYILPGDDRLPVLVVLESIYSDNDDLRLAEMAFQMNYKQVHSVCPVCYAEGENLCGHLTFKM